MAFIEVTRSGGQSALLNVDSVAMIHDRKVNGEKRVNLVLTTGVDFDVQDTYEDLVGRLTGDTGPV